MRAISAQSLFSSSIELLCVVLRISLQIYIGFHLRAQKIFKQQK